ncbi:3-oxoadipate enol-lactonase [Antrihabitans stalactiti]
MVEIAHARSGSGSTVVLLGSLGSDRSMWDPQVRALSADHDVLAVDIRGHGESPVATVDYTISSLADDVLELLDRLDIGSAHVVGLSLGGAIAQYLAAHAPTRVRTLTLLCTSAKFGEPGGWLDRAVFVRSNGTGALAEAVVGRWFSPEFAGSVDSWVAMVTNTPDEGYARCCEALAHWDGRADLVRITAPTLVIAGAQDPATTPADLGAIADAIPNSTLHVLNPGAHLVNVEQSDAVSRLIADHIAAQGLDGDL